MKKIIELKELRERFEKSLIEARVDREKSIIYNVCLLTTSSLNNRYYLPEALESAVPLFEGVQFFLNHDKGSSRKVEDLAGKVINPRFQENKVKGDLLVLEPHREMLFSLAENAPDLVGNSINGQGKVQRTNGKELVEGIVKIHSVDLVTDPAATISLFEQLELDVKEENDMNWKEITLKDLEENCPKVVKELTEAVLKQIEEEGDVKQLQEKLEELEKKNKELELKNDEHQVKEALQKKAEIRDKLLKEAKLPESALTDLFKKQLLAVEEETVDGKKVTIEEGMKKLIEDRKTVALAGSGKITGAGDEKFVGTITEADEGDEDKELKESKEKVSDNKIIKAVKGSQPSNILNQ